MRHSFQVSLIGAQAYGLIHTSRVLRANMHLHCMQVMTINYNLVSWKFSSLYDLNLHLSLAPSDIYLFPSCACVFQQNTSAFLTHCTCVLIATHQRFQQCINQHFQPSTSAFYYVFLLRSTTGTQMDILQQSNRFRPLHTTWSSQTPLLRLGKKHVLPSGQARLH